MSILTILLIALFFAAWKAPKLVEIIGNIALAYGVFDVIRSFAYAMDCIQDAGDVSLAVFCGGMKCICITMLYSLIVYIVSKLIVVVRSFLK